jgi:hypothetical protein
MIGDAYAGIISAGPVLVMICMLYRHTMCPWMNGLCGLVV